VEFFNKIMERGEDDISGEQPPYDSYREAIDDALVALPKRTANFEFLSKVLYREQDCIVASPLYVAILD
jgi:hypothetical protein